MNKFLIKTFAVYVCCAVVGANAVAQQAGEPPKPVPGQAGKDVVWVPTPDSVVEKMLDMARVTPQDYVIDLGSGDGRNVIAAARRGARALGVEYNPDLVELSRRAAAQAGVADKAVFVQGDMFAADISKASVLALFLLPDNLQRLLPKFLDLKPGSRIVSNTYEIGSGWTPDATETVRSACISFCLAVLYVVPAKVEGIWRMGEAELSLRQEFQYLAGTFSSDGIDLPVEHGRLEGENIRFSVNGVEYVGRVNGDKMSGAAKGRTERNWTASRDAR